jgi:hypothetical protein
LAAVERRLDDLCHVLSSVGRHQQCFGPTVKVDILRISENRSQESTDAGAARLTSDDRIQVFTQSFCVRALAAPLQAF